jgi:YidC/Oxa1 family membrane protein insertase
MERSSITRWLFLGLAVVLFLTFGRKALSPNKASELQPAGPMDYAVQVDGPPEERCTIDGSGFKAELSTHGASLRHLWLVNARFDPPDSHQRLDLVSTTNPSRMPLRTDLRLPFGDDSQVAFDDLAWKLAASDGKSCTFTYNDAATSLKKVVAAGEHPYELAVTAFVQNLADTAKKHRFTIEQTAWRQKKDLEGGFGGRQSEWSTEVIAVTGAKTERHAQSDFEPSDFSKPEFTPEKWRRAPGEAKAAAVGSVYFSGVVMPTEGPGAPAAETLVHEVWDRQKYPNKDDAKDLSYVFRARAAYPEKALAPKETVTYKALAYMGPKDRDALAAVDHGATEVLNLGTFSLIAGWLVKYLHALYGVVHSWGWAIVLLTITVRTLLFPLSLTQIKSSMAMRKLKPEMDALNEKYKDDAAQRGLAIQELWRKNNVTNPVLGCLPMLLQMPVWWALYTALQTAVELYHVPFGPVIPDLTAPGKYFIIPIVLGASSFLQQKLMPAQGDPQQQKMMMYMMPAIFTVMMLFLPAGLGVYMLTNSLLAIGQQLLVERYLRGGGGTAGQIEVREKATGDGDKPTPSLGKGKARVRG